MRYLIGLLLLGCTPAKDDSSTDTDTDSSVQHTAGPDGVAMAVNECGPADGYMLRILVNGSEDSCEAQANAGWGVELRLLTPPVSGHQYTMEDDLWMGRLDHDGEHFATSAQLVLDFAGDWQEGVAFSGSYVLEGDFPSVEGSFDGHYCEIEVMCG